MPGTGSGFARVESPHRRHTSSRGGHFGVATRGCRPVSGFHAPIHWPSTRPPLTPPLLPRWPLPRPGLQRAASAVFCCSEASTWRRPIPRSADLAQGCADRAGDFPQTTDQWRAGLRVFRQGGVPGRSIGAAVRRGLCPGFATAGDLLWPADALRFQVVAGVARGRFLPTLGCSAPRGWGKKGLCSVSSMGC